MRDRDYLFSFKFHRKEQWDLNRAGDIIPVICISLETPDSSRRIFCLWKYGIQVGGFLLTPRLVQFGRRFFRWAR